MRITVIEEPSAAGFSSVKRETVIDFEPSEIQELVLSASPETATAVNKFIQKVLLRAAKPV